MKKTIILLSILIISLVIILFNVDKPTIMPVYSSNDYNLHIYKIDISSADITTKNLFSNFSKYTILSIEPDINPIYQNIINLKTFPFEQYKSIDANINEFIKLYTKELENKAFNSDVQKIKYEGVKINKIQLYITDLQLNQLLNNSNYKLIN